MAIIVHVTSTAHTQIQNLSKSSPLGFWEFDHMLEIASGASLPGDQHRLDFKNQAISVLNHQNDIYFLTPPSPGPYIVVIHERKPSLIVALLKDRTTALPWGDKLQKENLTREAAVAFNITVSDIHTW